LILSIVAARSEAPIVLIAQFKAAPVVTVFRPTFYDRRMTVG
jgi:hypothetical protein